MPAVTLPVQSRADEEQAQESVADRSFSPLASLDKASPRIALLTPYSGNNFGDEAIQDSMIENLTLRMPRAEFSGISLNNDNYLRRHGSRAFPICASGQAFYGMARDAEPSTENKNPGQGNGGVRSHVKAALRRIPGSRAVLRRIKSSLKMLRREARHCREGYRFLKAHDLLIVCGGGQLDEEWGGPWGHPFALFKWMILARLAGAPYVMASVGACKADSPLSRLFLGWALRGAIYRSYRDDKSKDIAAGLSAIAADDAVAPDLAFGMPASEIPERVPPSARQRPMIAISPIVYAKPGCWPSADQALYERYLDQLSAVISGLLASENSVAFVWSSVSDAAVVQEIVSRLDEDAKSRLTDQAFFPEVTGWKSLLSVLRNADMLIASRLHSVIFGFLAQIPVVALSFDRKVDWIMQDLKQTSLLHKIGSFTAQDVEKSLKEIAKDRSEIKRALCAYREGALERSNAQFDSLCRIATAGMKNRVRTANL